MTSSGPDLYITRMGLFVDYFGAKDFADIDNIAVYLNYETFTPLLDGLSQMKMDDFIYDNSFQEYGTVNPDKCRAGDWRICLGQRFVSHAGDKFPNTSDGVIVHEGLHLFLSKIDYAYGFNYGVDDVKSLARKNPEIALHNPDSIEYFYESWTEGR